MKKYLIKKIFGPTIQGEGTHIGKAVSFVRFSGCNKWSGRKEDKASSICSFCDTDFFGGERMTKEEISYALDKLNCKTVILSGGEPTLQIKEELLTHLVDKGYKLHLETNGSKELPLIFFDLISHISMSPKQGINDTKLQRCNDIKLLYPFINDKITIDAFKSFKFDQMYLQPVEDSHYNVNLFKTVNKCAETGLKMSPQLHKLIGVE